MKKLIYIGILVLALGMVNCNQDKFLEEDPSTFYTIDNAITNSDQADQALIPAYNAVRNLWSNPARTGPGLEFRFNGTDMYDVAGLNKGDSFNNYNNINALHENFYDIFTEWYRIISYANFALYVADLPQVNWESAEDKAYIVAQARFFRAFAYRNLGELFGGVPIITEITTAPRYDYERAGRIETYQFAIDELEAIEDDLPVTTPEEGRLARGAAQHNLCELYLAMGIEMEAAGDAGDAQAAYNSSISYANKLIDGGTYSLINTRFGSRSGEQSVSIDIYRNGVFSPSEKVDTLQMEANYYWDLFQGGNVDYQDGNTECIWALQSDYYVSQSQGKLDGNARLFYPYLLSPGFREVLYEHVVGIQANLGGDGGYRVIPTMYARDSIYAGVWRDDMRNSEAVFRRRIKGNVPTSPYYQKAVPWDYMYKGSSDEIVNTNNRSLCFPISCKIAPDHFDDVQVDNDTQTLLRNDYFIRLPETILLRAEAKQRLGDKAGAAADINSLRSRAQCGYLVTANDMDDDFNMILDERARELVYEECRWNTLLRMGGTVAVDRIRKYAFWPEAKQTLTFDYNLWPIPQQVRDANIGADMTQNPGWN